MARFDSKIMDRARRNRPVDFQEIRRKQEFKGLPAGEAIIRSANNYAEKKYGALLRTMDPAVSIEDIVSDAFLKLYRTNTKLTRGHIGFQLRRYVDSTFNAHIKKSFSTESLEAILKKGVKEVYSARQRGLKKSHEELFTESLANKGIRLRTIQDMNLRRILAHEIKKLTKVQRYVLFHRLNDWHLSEILKDKDFKELSKTKSEQGVDSIYQSALKKLRDVLVAEIELKGKID